MIGRLKIKLHYNYIRPYNKRRDDPEDLDYWCYQMKLCLNLNGLVYLDRNDGFSPYATEARFGDECDYKVLRWLFGNGGDRRLIDAKQLKHDLQPHQPLRKLLCAVYRGWDRPTIGSQYELTEKAKCASAQIQQILQSYLSFHEIHEETLECMDIMDYYE